MKRTISKMLAAGFAATLLTLPASRIAAQITIVPQPQEVKLQAGKASVSANPKVYLDKKAKQCNDDRQETQDTSHAGKDSIHYQRPKDTVDIRCPHPLIHQTSQRIDTYFQDIL